MARYRTYNYDIKNLNKYRGSGTSITVRSSWELTFAEHCDLLPSVLSWSYETHQIPYRDPLTGSQKIYIPDFFVEVAQADGYTKHFVFEIKPMHEQLDGFARNRKDAALVARNNAKWFAATQWADRHSAEFVVLNENDLFSFHNNRAPRKNPVKAFARTEATKSTGQLATAKKPKMVKARKPKLSPQRRTTTTSVKRTKKVGRIKKR